MSNPSSVPIDRWVRVTDGIHKSRLGRVVSEKTGFLTVRLSGADAFSTTILIRTDSVRILADREAAQ